MELKLNDLENKLFTSRKPDLAWGALVASGLKDQHTLDGYLNKLSTLCQDFQTTSPSEDKKQKARALFDWLWSTKPNRYESQGNFRLTNVIDVQIDPSADKVGNCLGLTLLFNILAQKQGLKVKAIHLEDASGIGPHVISILNIARSQIDVENTLSNGFDFKEHLKNQSRELWGDIELIADIYHSIGNEFFDNNDLDEAIRNYTKAIYLNHNYTKAYLNRGIALAMLGREDAAKLDLDK